MVRMFKGGQVECFVSQRDVQKYLGMGWTLEKVEEKRYIPKKTKSDPETKEV